MTPTIPVGSVVVVRPVDPQSLKAGDVATYQVRKGEDVFVTHRIIDIVSKRGGPAFKFQGDANSAPDESLVPSGAVRGKVWYHLPYVGTVRDAVRGPGGVTLLVLLALGGYAVSQLSAGLRERRTTSAAPTGLSSQPLILLTAAFTVDEVPSELPPGWTLLTSTKAEREVHVVIALSADASLEPLPALAKEARDVQVWRRVSETSSNGLTHEGAAHVA
jgi:signal peptidase